MLLLAHTGITLGAAVLATGGLAAVHRPVANKPAESADRSSRSVLSRVLQRVSSWLAILSRRVDIRLLLVAALLPDIIDKPVGLIFFGEAISNGRIFAHTLLFLILVTLPGLYLYRSRGQLWLLVIAFGVLMHLVLDQMWLMPRTLLWPFLGVTFPREDIGDWVPATFHELLSNPAVYITELIGAVILVWFGWWLISNRKLFSFIRYGKIG